MKKIFKSLSIIIAIIAIMGFTGGKSLDNSVDSKKCKYYSYVVYGKAMKNGMLKDKELVYKGFKRYKSTGKFFACFDQYRGIESGGFKVINIGPYDTETVFYQEINRVRDDLEDDGYIKAKKFTHTVTGTIIYGNKPCD